MGDGGVDATIGQSGRREMFEPITSYIVVHEPFVDHRGCFSTVIFSALSDP
jgi:hypothetical protein